MCLKNFITLRKIVVNVFLFKSQNSVRFNYVARERFLSMGKLEHYSAKRRATQGVQRKKAISTAFENEQLTQGVAQAVSQPDARSLTPDVVRSLQRSHGNQFVQRLVNTANRSGIQRTPEPIRASTTPRLQRLA